MGAQAGDGVVDIVNGEHDAMQAQRVGRRVLWRGVGRRGAWYLASSSWPWPSGVRIIAMSLRTPPNAAPMIRPVMAAGPARGWPARSRTRPAPSSRPVAGSRCTRHGEWPASVHPPD
jgi:hypothetical protein